jgi:hypothetical protein
VLPKKKKEEERKKRKEKPFLDLILQNQAAAQEGVSHPSHFVSQPT